MKKAIYAGSFDPITYGHISVIEQTFELFDYLYIAVGTNPDKKYTFSLLERMEMVEQTLYDYIVGEGRDIEIVFFHNQFLVDYAKAIGAAHIVRGLRTQADYEFERRFRNINSDLRPEIATVFFMPPRELTEISSSLIKGFVGVNGWQEIVKKYVPYPVFKKLVKRFEKEGKINADV